MKFNKDGVLYLSSIRVLGVGSGAMVGDASGLTNIMGTNIVGAVAESSHATNADIAVSASNATNLWGQITVTNLPPGVLTNNWNGPTVVITNASLVVTGAQYFAVSNGAAKVLLTNGIITGSGQATFAGVTATANNSSFARVRTTPGSAADAAVGSNVATGTGLYMPNTTNVALTAGGVEQIRLGNNVATSPCSITATNGFYYSSTSNGVVSTNVIQPLHTFAALMGFVTNTINGGANTYAIVTNYSTARTNLMSCSLIAGTITNSIAGYYYVAIHMSMVSLDAGALVEGDLLLNSVERDEVSFQTQFDPGTPRYKGASAFGILYIPANTQITFQIKSSGASGIQLRRQQLVVMPP